MAEAYLFFANSEAGIEFLSQFAEAGQTIGDHTFQESGAFHQQSVDLFFGAANINSLISADGDIQGDEGASASTGTRATKNDLLITVWVNTELNINNKHAKSFKENPESDSKRNLFILDRTGSIFHESMIHAQLFAEDFCDDCSLNDSSISKSVIDRVNKIEWIYNRTSMRHHLEGRKEGSMFINKGVPAMQKIHKQQNSGVSSKDVKKDMLNFSNN